MTTYSNSLKLELPGDGQQTGTWGQTTNKNFGDLLEQAICDNETIVMADANRTLTNLNGTLDEARNAVLIITGTNSAQRDIIAPTENKLYTIYNNTTGGFPIRIIGSSGTGVVIPNGMITQVFFDGTNYVPLQNGVPTNFVTYGNLGVTGTTVLDAGLSGTTATFSGAISSVSPTFTGTVTVPTPTVGDNTTKAATTAFVTSAITGQGLGTMSTQNANSVAITGGTISGLGTPLAVASGGVGAATLSANAVLLGNGTSAVQTVAPGTSGNVLTSNGTTWVAGSAPAPTSGSGSLGNGSTFNVTTGSSGVALITVEFLSLANVGNFGGATGYLSINGSNVASKYTQTIEYSSRNSGCGGVILYRYTGSPNSTVTGGFSWSGAGSFNSASYMYIGI